MKKDIVKIMWKFITDSDFRFLVMGKYGLLNYMDDEKYLKRMYQINMGKKLDLANPKLFNEKLQWLKLYDRNPLYTTMVDKYAVKKYVGEIIGDEYIIPTIGVWNSAEDIDFDALNKQISEDKFSPERRAFLSSQYKESLTYIAEEILGEQDVSIFLKALKNFEKGE